jgi:hypothetical protein
MPEPGSLFSEKSQPFSTVGLTSRTGSRDARNLPAAEPVAWRRSQGAYQLTLGNITEFG